MPLSTNYFWLLLILMVLQQCNHVTSGFSLKSTSTTSLISSSKFTTTIIQNGRNSKVTRCYAFDENKSNNGKGKARFTGIEGTTTTTDGGNNGFTNILDYTLSIISSDVGSIILGLFGLILCVSHRLANLDVLSTSAVETMGQETRSDLLAVFASGAVLLNGISKLDVTSALAESVILDGIALSKPIVIHDDKKVAEDNIIWALESAIEATPTKSAVLLKKNSNDNDDWMIIALAGIIPRTSSSNNNINVQEVQQLLLPTDKTPILNRFQTTSTKKETYLPTLQALPGRVEFTYLPPNAQEALLLPVQIIDNNNEEERSSSSTTTSTTTVLVLGSDTAKSFTPRDIAWCQVLASRIGTFL